MPEQNISNSSSEISLADISQKLKSFFRYLRSKWKIFLLLSVVGGLAGIAYAWQQKAKYEAILTFSMEDDKGSTGGLAGLASQFGLDLGGVGGTFSGENILAFVQSGRMIESTLLSKVLINGQKESLLNAYLDIYEWRKGFKKSELDKVRNLSFPDGQDMATFSRVQDSILLKIVRGIQKKDLKISKPETKLNMYKVSFTSIDESFSIAFCNQLIQQVTQFYTETKTKRSAKIVSILQNTADSIKSAYNLALMGRAELSDANLNSAFQTPIVGIQRKQTDITVLATAYGEVLKNLEIAKFNLLKDAPLIQVIDTPMQPLEKNKFSRLLAGILVATGLGFIYCAFLCVKFLFAKKTETKA